VPAPAGKEISPGLSAGPHPVQSSLGSRPTRGDDLSKNPRPPRGLLELADTRAKKCLGCRIIDFSPPELYFLLLGLLVRALTPRFFLERDGKGPPRNKKEKNRTAFLNM